MKILHFLTYLPVLLLLVWMGALVVVLSALNGPLVARWLARMSGGR